MVQDGDYYSFRLDTLSAAFIKYPWVTGVLGALIALFEGLQQLNQYHIIGSPIARQRRA
jgi:hypothetical protein